MRDGPVPPCRLVQGEREGSAWAQSLCRGERGRRLPRSAALSVRASGPNAGICGSTPRTAPRLGVVANPIDTVPFRSLVTQASAVLLTHGVEVEAAAVQGVAARLVETLAQQSGMDPEEAVHLVTPEAIADAIAKATAEEKNRAPALHAVRPVRIDNSTVHATVEALGHLVMAASQAAKYAGLNSGGAAAAHLLDLATEIGAALVKHHEGGAVDVEVGVLDELAGLVDEGADRVEAEGWSICPCGEEHGQSETDSGTVPVMRHHAALARRLRGGVE